MPLSLTSVGSTNPASASGGAVLGDLGANARRVALSKFDSTSYRATLNPHQSRCVISQQYHGSEGWGSESLRTHQLRNMFQHNMFRTRWVAIAMHDLRSERAQPLPVGCSSTGRRSELGPQLLHRRAAAGSPIRFDSVQDRRVSRLTTNPTTVNLKRKQSRYGRSVCVGRRSRFRAVIGVAGSFQAADHDLSGHWF